MASSPSNEEINRAMKTLEKNIGKVDELSKEIEKIRKEELRSDYVIGYLVSMDVPDRSGIFKILSSSGLKTLTLRCWTDDLAMELLEQYNSGRSLFTLRLHGGFISQILPNDKFPGKVEELSNVLSRTPMITSHLSENDKVAEANMHPNDSRGMKLAVRQLLSDWNRAKRKG